MSNQIRELLEQYVDKIHQIYGDDLRMVILYGSYARGDFTTTSDIDIMILVNTAEKVIKEKGHELSDMTYDFNLDHDIEIMPMVEEISHFQYWLQANPFYKNVQNEGVPLYAA